MSRRSHSPRFYGQFFNVEKSPWSRTEIDGSRVLTNRTVEALSHKPNMVYVTNHIPAKKSENGYIPQRPGANNNNNIEGSKVKKVKR